MTRDTIPAMPMEQAFLVRGADGRMATVIARSVRGAVKTYLRKHRPRKGDCFSVKPRGTGDWHDFKVH
jgi:hypothetical protein